MKNLLLFVFFYMLTLACFSQSRFSYYNSYIDGFHHGCECSNEPNNKNELYNKNGSKLKGYRDGYIDGRIFIHSHYENSVNQNQIFLQNEKHLNEVYKGLAYRQMKYDKRKVLIQDYYDTVYDLLVQYNEINGDVSTAKIKVIEKFDKSIKTYSKYDLSIDSTWYEIERYCIDNIKYVLGWFD